METPKFSFFVDPAGEGAVIAEYLNKIKVKPQFALLTHAHFDHFAAAAELERQELLSKIYLPEADEECFRQATTYSLLVGKRHLQYPEHRAYFDPSLAERLAAVGLRWMAVPGHTPGSHLFYRDDLKLMFSGDTIVHNCLTPEAEPFFEDQAQLKTSLLAMNEMFPPRCLIFPGHGVLTMLVTEMNYNPKIKQLLKGTEA